MKVLITGGAGYIGSHIAKCFKELGNEVVILDDLSNSDAKRIESLNVEFVEASICNSSVISKVVSEIDLVIHCAAVKSVDESERNPELYYDVNVGGTNVLLEVMIQHNKREIIFASSAAVYGNSAISPIKESDLATPISVYGKTKLQAENLISKFSIKNNLSAISLRFFNAVGTATNSLADTSVENLFPKVFSAIGKGVAPQIYGDDYPTKDGTCVRDYVHVIDIAEAHLAAYKSLKTTGGHRIYNVGTGIGYSVREIISEIQKISVSSIDPVIMPRRKGDLDIAFADTALIEYELNWNARFGLEEMVRSSWLAWQNHP